jgi:hypothetical protein
MSTRTITLPADQWEAILEAVQDHWDEGPRGEGWQSSRLSAASAALSTTLAQPEPEVAGLSDDAIEADFRSWYNERYHHHYFGAIPLVECIEWTRYALTRYGTRPQPVPVVERPWEREGWCDAEGRCWWGRPSEELCNSDWHLATRAEVEEFCSGCMPIVSLPHHALPVPTH